METCENCGRTIGNLETPRLVDGHVVCAECEGRLRPTLGYSSGRSVRPAVTLPRAGEIICPNPNCGYRGPPMNMPKAKLGVSLALLGLWVGFGVVWAAGERNSPDAWIVSVACFVGWLGYTVFMHGTVAHCPDCGLRIT